MAAQALPAPGTKGPPAAIDPGLIDRAHRGDEAAVLAVRRALARDPDRLIKLGCGDIAELAMDVAIKTAAGNDGLMAEALEAKAARLRRELVGPEPSPLERLLAERVAICWIQLHRIEILAEGAEQKARPVEALERRRDRAHRRYLQAIKSLAQVRKLALPAILQVNIGEQQVIAPNGINGNGPGVRRGPPSGPAGETRPRE